MKDQDTIFGIIPFKRIENKDFFLLVKCRKGHWGFPKGHSHKNEGDRETALRELMEETGIDMSNVTVFDSPSFAETRLEIQLDQTVVKTIIWFLGKVANDAKVNVWDTDEIVDHTWLRFDEAYELLSHDETKRVFLDARLFLAKIESDATINVARS